MKKILQNINLEQTIFDFVVIVFIVLFDFMLVKSGKTIIDFLNPNSALALIFVIQFFVTYQLGKLFTIYNNRRINKFVSKIVKITLFLVILFLYIGLPPNLERFDLLEDNYMMWAFVGGIFSILLGGIIGFNAEESSAVDIATGAGIISIVIAAFGLILLMLYIGIDRHSWLIAILVFVAGIIICTLIYIAFNKIVEKFSQRQTNKYVKIVFKIIFTTITALSIITWQSIHLYSNSKFSVENNGFIDINFLIFSLFLTGILPFRILWAFSDTKKLFSIISGLIFIAVDIYSIVNY